MAALVAFGCKGDPPRSETASSGSSAPAPLAGSARAATGSGDAAATGSASTATTIGSAPKVEAARCDEPCLFLVDTPLDQVGERYTHACAGKATTDPGFTDCKQLDYMRNCIYAAHGLVFKKTKWKVFRGKPWYEPHAEFRAKQISALERANVHELYERGKRCKKGLHISGGDYDRLKAWFAGLRSHRADLPEVLTVRGAPERRDVFVQYVIETAAVPERAPVSLPDLHASASYEALDHTAADLAAAAKRADEPGLRAIEVSYDPGSPVQLHFLFDRDDKLVAIDLEYADQGEDGE